MATTTNWHNAVLKQLGHPKRIADDALLPPSTLIIDSPTKATMVGIAMVSEDPVLKAGSELVGEGSEGFAAGSAFMTKGANPTVLNAAHKTFVRSADKRGLSTAINLRLGRTMTTAPKGLTDKAKVGYFIAYGLQGAPDAMKEGLAGLLQTDESYLDGFKVAVNEIAKSRGYESAFGIDLNPIDAISNAVDTVSDAISSIPGIGDAWQFFGGQAKDFAGTAFGQVALTAFATVSYGALAPALGALGPQLAAVTFAIPGLAKGDPFDKAWVEAFVSRLEKLAEYFGGKLAADAAAQFQPAMDKLVQDAADQGLGVDQLADKLQLTQFSVDQLNKMAADAGIRPDILQQALDYASKQVVTAADAAIVQSPAWLGLGTITVPAVPGRTFDLESGIATGDNRIFHAATDGNLQMAIAGGNKNFVTLASVQAKKALNKAYTSAGKIQTNAPIGVYTTVGSLKKAQQAAPTSVEIIKAHWYQKFWYWVRHKPLPVYTKANY